MKLNLFPGGSQYAGRDKINFNIKKEDKVVDIGGGNKPYHLATHIIDMTNNKEQRYGQNIKVGNLEFLDGDVCDILPEFIDDYFDFCYSSHTFEHIENLPLALDLISSKCKRGFYALPASDIEFFSTENFFCHVNICRLIGGVLHIAKRPVKSVLDDLGKCFGRLLKDKEFSNLFQEKYRFLWEARHYWEGKIEYKMCDILDIYPQVECLIK